MANSVQQSFKNISALIIVLLLFSCAQQQTETEKSKEEAGPKVTEAIATIQAAEGQNVTGTVRFTRTGKGVQVEARLNNLSQGKHGFHIHQYGNCSDSQGFTTAGGHYNPEKQQHGSPTADQRHVGDMGNVPAGPEGTAELTYTDQIIQLNGKNSVIGRAVIIHAGEDDLESQPSGDAGSRVGCGVIGIVKTEQDTATASGNM